MIVVDNLTMRYAISGDDHGGLMTRFSSLYVALVSQVHVTFPALVSQVTVSEPPSVGAP